ncbi:hypothetical protein C8R44DRAFT_725547 [Mycena epipterygia]|nr:hypothetical protein C8R44DRAFT_725547 [Mycena epipterygia]
MYENSGVNPVSQSLYRHLRNSNMNKSAEVRSAKQETRGDSRLFELQAELKAIREEHYKYTVLKNSAGNNGRLQCESDRNEHLLYETNYYAQIDHIETSETRDSRRARNVWCGSARQGDGRFPGGRLAEARIVGEKKVPNLLNLYRDMIHLRQQRPRKERALYGIRENREEDPSSWFLEII